jgi:glycolate oxidase FAD binding subunit
VDLTALCAEIDDATAVVCAGARTHWDVGNAVTREATTVRAPGGVAHYEPADMTITVGAATTFAALDATLAAQRQQCALDPRDSGATVGGILACGLSGRRRLAHGPVRDHVLEVRFVTADGRVVKGGGPTVKNVTGYDLPRLMVGSFGTLGVLAQVTLRCRPRPAVAQWFRAPAAPAAAVRPSSVWWDGDAVSVLLEGTETDVAARAGAWEPCDAPPYPDGSQRGRISVAPGALRAAASALGNVRWSAELGVGTIHVATDDAAALARARDVAHAHGGWMLREAGGAGLDGFGCPLPNATVMRRIKDAFDPGGKLAPGRLPL